MMAHDSPLWQVVAGRSWPLLVAYASLGTAFAWQAPQVFPSGGDPGHMVYLGRSFDGWTSHPPLVPALMGLVHAVSFSSFGALSLLVKLFATLSLAVFVYGLHRLTAALSPRPLAAQAALVLAAVNPMALYELLWGGLAQFWGMAFACLAIASALRWSEGPRRRTTALCWTLATWYAHWYTGAFAVVVVAVVLVSQRFWRPLGGPEWRRLAAVGAVGAFPLVLLYTNLAPDLRLMADVRAIATLSYMPAFGSVLATRPVVVAGGALLLSMSLLWGGLVLRRRRPPRPHVHFALGWSAGFLVLLAGTPASLAGRAYYFLPILLVPFAAIAVTHAFQAHGRVVAVVATVGATVMAGGALAAYHEDQPFFNPLEEASASAFLDLENGAGATAVYSPIANVDAWWLEAVTGRPSLGTDAARYYARQSEVEALDAAMRIAAGEHILDVGAGFVATSPTHHMPAPVSLWLRERQNPVPVLAVDEAGAALVVDGRSILLGAADSTEGAAAASWRTSAGLVERSVELHADAVALSYHVPPGTERVELPAGPGWGGAFGIRDGVLAHHWAKDDVASLLAVTPQPVAVQAERAVFELAVVDGTARLVMPLKVTDAGAQWVLSTSIARDHGVAAVYARDAPVSLIARFQADEGFQPRFREGDVFTWDLVASP